ncbi:MAG TPA: hypothetical protein VHK88_17930, partial [Aquihabitans sp.]|nr:hypothetical protein [Aquihabitans sp.]
MPAEVRTVHVVAKTHLDLGFTDLAAEVADRYVDEHVPRAISVAAELRARRPQPGAPAPQLVWTTGSWILHHALHHGRPEQRAAVAEAVERGVLRWHAL